MASLGEADEARQVYAIADALRNLVGRPDDEAWRRLCDLAAGEQVVRYADALGAELGRLGDLTAARVAPHARRMVREACGREALKLGILLLGLYGDASDLEMLLTLGRHEEFTLFSALAVARLVPDPVALWWRMARGLQGWGKVHLVERICDVLEESEGGHEEVRAWLLREGCENNVLPEYVACRCAIGGDLHRALAASAPDEALLDGASTIFEALMNDEGPSEDMTDYEHGVEVAQRLLDHLERDCDALKRLSTVVVMHAWIENIGVGPEERRNVLEALGWTPHRRNELLARCKAIIERDCWKSKVEAAYQSDDANQRQLAWSVASAVGVDLWEKAFRLLERNPLDDELYYTLLQSDDLYRQRRVMAFAERNLPLDKIASGPSTELGFGEEWRPHQCLTFVLQELRRPGLFSPSLVIAGLRSPVVRVRTMAAAALESQPVDTWGPDMAEALERSLKAEPNDKLRGRLQELWLRL